MLSISFIYSSDFKVKKDLILQENEVFDDNIISIRGNIDIKGKVNKSIIIIGGKLRLFGHVEEDLICISSDVKIYKNAFIKGDLFVIGGKLEKDPEMRLQGEYSYFKFNLKKIETTLLPIISDSQSMTFFKAAKIILWLILALIIFAIIPKKINHAEEIFEKNMLRIGITGILSILAFILLFLIFIILSFVIIGIPLLFILILFYFVLIMFGRTVLLYFIGIKILKTVNIKNVTPALFIFVGISFYLMLKFLPVFGPILLIIFNMFEIGIGMSFLFRKKIPLK
jgi:cytoskeletal protein CcmA (bactofilin family)